MAVRGADFRSLKLLTANASTARVLNLGDLHRRRASGDALYERPDQPMFSSPVLDSALIVKHRLRPDEVDRLKLKRSTATKVLMPLDRNDLGLGAACVFVGEPSWREKLANYAMFDSLQDRGERDVRVLAVLDTLPSLDPFLVRERLARQAFEIDPGYFAINPADVQRMSAYVRVSIVPLVQMCVGSDSEAKTERLAAKLLSAELDESLHLLRQTLQLPIDKFEEGMFCWKGLLYYKWVIHTHMAQACDVARTISRHTWVGPATLEEKAYLNHMRERLAIAIARSVASVNRALCDYDGAFNQLVSAADPIAFRDFLLNAPVVFAETGEQLGALQHIVSYWSYHSTLTREDGVGAAALCDILRDFETSLGLRKVMDEPAAFAA